MFLFNTSFEIFTSTILETILARIRNFGKFVVGKEIKLGPLGNNLLFYLMNLFKINLKYIVLTQEVGKLLLAA